MRALLAMPSIRTKARKVEPAQRLPHMLLTAPLPQGTEALLVVRTGRQSCRRIDMQVVAILAADAVATAVVVCAFRPCADVVFVQVVALVALFAEPFQPVLADEVVVVVVAVFVGAEVTQRAEALAVCLADRSVGIETEAVFAFEEVGEGEIVGWRLLGSVGALVVEIHRSGAAVVDSGGHDVYGFCAVRQNIKQLE